MENRDMLMIKTEQEVEEMLRCDLALYFSILSIDEEKQLEFLKMISKILQRIYFDYLSDKFSESLEKAQSEK